MYVFRELTDLCYPAIARLFGGRDHTTVIHANEKIQRLMSERKRSTTRSPICSSSSRHDHPRHDRARLGPRPGWGQSVGRPRTTPPARWTSQPVHRTTPV